MPLPFKATALKLQFSDGDSTQNSSPRTPQHRTTPPLSPKSPVSPAISEGAKSAPPTAFNGKLSFLNELYQKASALKRVAVEVTSPKSPASPTSNRPLRRQRTLVQRSSQVMFKDRDQTAIVLDFDDTLFPATYVDSQSGLHCQSAADQQEHMDEAELKERLEQIDECQKSAEMLLQCAQNFGRIMIVTLSTRGILEKRCQIWYPRVWKLVNDAGIKIIYAKEVHKSMLKKGDQQKLLSAQTASQQENSRFSAGYWAWVKGRAIAQELDNFYSQYPGQTWKNILCIGDSDFERYGMLGAASAYVQTRFNSTGGKFNKEASAYVAGWQLFDTDPEWSQLFEGIHEGHMFKVRIKVVKLLEDPSPDALSKQLAMILELLPSMVCHDGCLNMVIDELQEKTLHKLEAILAPMAPMKTYSADIIPGFRHHSM